MDSDTLAKDYMTKYDDLTKKYQNSDIKKTLDDINSAIRNANIDAISPLYNKILDWNSEVANLEGARTSLNGQFKYLHLPSVNMFTILFDENEKKWQFSGGTN